jgi:hypothetical protein
LPFLQLHCDGPDQETSNHISFGGRVVAGGRIIIGALTRSLFFAHFLPRSNYASFHELPLIGELTTTASLSSFFYVPNVVNTLYATLLRLN